MSYDCPMFLCIDVSIQRYVQRYLLDIHILKYLISNVKTANPEKSAKIFKNFNRILLKITFS